MDEGDDDPTTQELRIVQRDREESERQAAERSESDAETAQHESRAAKSAYLKAKLEEREKAEREAE